MPKFRKKPVVIEAFRYGIDNLPGLTFPPEWFMDEVGPNGICVFSDHCLIPTLEGVMRAEVGDWIIRGVKGEIYPCRPDIFAATYEEVA